jgi:signal transduction histidine kinase
LKLQSNFIKKNLRKDQTDLIEECQNNEKYIDQIIENVHRLSRDMSPPVLEDLGLSKALRWLIDHFVKHYDIKVRFDSIDADHRFSREAEIMIFRIFQEAFTNIGKHAQAKNVSVIIKKDVDRLSFLLEDDGKGFDPNKAHMEEATERGMGLATMRERARLLGGSFDLQSQEGKGTLIRISVPIKTKDGEGL